MNIGVALNQVALEDYNPDWKALFEQEKAALEQVLDGIPVTIEHIGSTSVPDLKSKPILDIGIGVDDKCNIAIITDILSKNNYNNLGFRSEQMGVILERLRDGKRTHCIHILELTSRHWTDYLNLRNLLRANEHIRKDYELLKENLAALHYNNRKAYTAGKADFIQAHLKTMRNIP
ncbi:GrpB family protein [Ochrobactrum sp. MR28]|nr:GrpB family protein [Ochrobactrum sp. MR28]MBX8814871.1 GrpB family protein [Ochrobactrum sp. MR31]